MWCVVWKKTSLQVFGDLWLVLDFSTDQRQNKVDVILAKELTLLLTHDVKLRTSGHFLTQPVPVEPNHCAVRACVCVCANWVVME